MPKLDISLRPETAVLHGSHGERYLHGTVNPPVQHASTLTAPDYLSFIGKKPWTPHYGRQGLQTHRALEEAVSRLEHAASTVLTGSGLQAVTLTLLSFLRSGDHLLIPDSVYQPVKTFADNVLTALNIQTDYYDPLIAPDALTALLTPQTRMLYLESPSSGTFEFQDTRGLCQSAKAHDKKIITVIDNTWAAGVYHQPLALGCDVSLTAGTKYLSGHADVLLGTVSAKEQAHGQKLKETSKWHGIYVAPDEAYLALRGLRTLHVRLEQHQRTASMLAAWLESQDEVTAVLHPEMPNHFGRDYFARDFSGASGLFGFFLNQSDERKLQAFFDEAELFAMGYSWGGYESLMIPVPRAGESLPHLQPFIGQTLVRIHAGLEHPEDLRESLQSAFAAMRGV